MHRLQAFTDREEEVALFEELRGPNPDGSWPLLPILAFIAPGGSGKSTLIKHLIEKCSVDGGKPAVPYAHLNFTVPSAPKDLWSILVELRNQLQDCADGQGKRLTFPRFELGALIVQAATEAAEDLSAFTPSKVQRTLSRDKQAFESLTAVGSTLGFLVPYLPAVLAGIKLVGQIPAVQSTVRRILGHLRDSTDWKWYRRQSTRFELHLGATASMEDVLLRLYELSRQSRPEREQLIIRELLPAAFAADLYGELVEATQPRAWSKKANVVIFLDGFEALQDASSTTATSLLRGLTTEPRREGQTDPLLLVIGGRDPLPGMTADQQQPVPFPRTEDESKATATQRMQDLHTQWQQRSRTQPDWLKDLVLPVRLRDFGLEDTRKYLLKVGEERKQRAIFEADDLVQAIDQVTHGQPLFLALAAEAVLRAKRPLLPAEFQRAPVSPEIDPEHEGEAIGKYLLDLLLKQLPVAEQKDLVSCAVPRVLDEDVLRVVLSVLLPSLDDIDARDRWEGMRQRSFLSPVDEQRSVMHPVVRELLLRRLRVSADSKSTFVKIHTRLKDHFTQRARMHVTAGPAGDAQIEAAYHALALGDANPAIRLGIRAQGGGNLWELLLEAVRQAPSDLLPKDTEAHAENALVRAREPAATAVVLAGTGDWRLDAEARQHQIQDAATAIVLYTWLLSATHDDREESARLQNRLGVTYGSLPGGVTVAFATGGTGVAVPFGVAGPFPVTGWAQIQMPRRLEAVIAHYRSIGDQVRTREACPLEWAMTQQHLVIAHSASPTGGDRAANLQHAIDYFRATLQVYTREAFPLEWAMTQHNLGVVHGSLLSSLLSSGDRAANLQHAIDYFRATLQVYTREAFPLEWAMTQHNLGVAYGVLPTGDRAANLQHAIGYYEAALQLYTSAHMDDDSQAVTSNLELAKGKLQKLTQPPQQAQPGQEIS